MSNTENTTVANLEARVFPLREQKGNLLAFASVTIADCFAVNGVKVLDSEKGLFVAMPQARDGQGEWRDVCFPINAEMRKEITNAVLEAYNAAKEKVQERASVKDQVKDGAEKAKSQPKKEKAPKGDDAR